MEASFIKSFMDITKSIHESVKDAGLTSNTMMQAGLNSLEVKKSQLNALLKESRSCQDMANTKLSQLRGEIEVYKSTLEIATKENM